MRCHILTGDSYRRSNGSSSHTGALAPGEGVSTSGYSGVDLARYSARAGGGGNDADMAGAGAGEAVDTVTRTPHSHSIFTSLLGNG